MENLIRPDFLKEGDLIYVCAPSGRLDQAKVNAGIKFLEGSGFRIELGEHLYSNHYKFSAPAGERLRDLQRGLDHTDAKAVFCARGGFGITQIVDQLSWDNFQQNPKWLLGFSDITALLHECFLNGIESMHAPVIQQLSGLSKHSQQSLLDGLKGKFPSLSSNHRNNIDGEGKGCLVGGNLSLIAHLIGTKSQLDYKGKILFIEEVGEPLYAIERMFIQLRRSGVFNKINGLVVGINSDLKETKKQYGLSFEEIVLQICNGSSFPIAFNLPFGHTETNMPLIHGAQITMNISSGHCKAEYTESY